MDSLQRSAEIPINKKKVISHQEKLSESDVLFEEHDFDDDSSEVMLFNTANNNHDVEFGGTKKQLRIMDFLCDTIVFDEKTPLEDLLASITKEIEELCQQFRSASSKQFLDRLKKLDMVRQLVLQAMMKQK